MKINNILKSRSLFLFFLIFFNSSLFGEEVFKDISNSIEKIQNNYNDIDQSEIESTINIDNAIKEVDNIFDLVEERLLNDDLESAIQILEVIDKSLSAITSSIPEEVYSDMSEVKIESLSEENLKEIKIISESMTNLKNEKISDLFENLIDLNDDGIAMFEKINNIESLGFDIIDIEKAITNNLVEVDKDLPLTVRYYESEEGKLIPMNQVKDLAELNRDLGNDYYFPSLNWKNSDGGISNVPMDDGNPTYELIKDLYESGNLKVTFDNSTGQSILEETTSQLIKLEDLNIHKGDTFYFPTLQYNRLGVENIGVPMDDGNPMYEEIKQLYADGNLKITVDENSLKNVVEAVDTESLKEVWEAQDTGQFNLADLNRDLGNDYYFPSLDWKNSDGGISNVPMDDGNPTYELIKQLNKEGKLEKVVGSDGKHYLKQID